MKQKKFSGNKTLYEQRRDKDPLVWEVGKKYDVETDSYIEVNGKPRLRAAK